MDKINKRIENDLCEQTIDLLKDKNLTKEYKESKSVIKKIDKLEKILSKKLSIKDTIEEIILEIVPPGTKGVIKGLKFNKIIKTYINSLNLDKERFELEFEKQHKDNLMSEIPDWYIYDKKSKKIIIGMNQLDFWSGGHQSNRGNYYIIKNDINNENRKFLCVICNKIKFKNDKTKVYKLFETGFKNNTLCYIKGLKKIIDLFFD